MPDISLFGEDAGHEAVLKALLARLSKDYNVRARVRTLSATGGITRVHHELSVYLKDIDRGKISVPDMIVLATDSNCKGYNDRRQEMQRVVEPYPALVNIVVYAIPDPHIERWLLTDATAFRSVLGRGCNLPQHKCQKDY